MLNVRLKIPNKKFLCNKCKTLYFTTLNKFLLLIFYDKTSTSSTGKIRIREWCNSILLCAFAFILTGCYNTTSNTAFYVDNYIDGKLYKIEKGFKIEVVASEPFIEAPVAIDFDNQGRIWTVEMKGFMKTIDDEGANQPIGTISILEDLNNDGKIDNAKIFIDSLIMPRAIAHAYGGLLYAEPPNLWFVDIVNDKPKNKILVDSLYTDLGNTEHQSNGLLINVDNWIYNAKSNYRYQRKDGHWIKEPTTFRGQWGISNDNFGRLYYNVNSIQLLGDYVFPNTTSKNKYFVPTASVNQKLTQDQHIFPIHPTSVNRGYYKGVLNQDSLVVNVTSACGPLIYRGNMYPKSFNQNAFVCAPEANLVKRHILKFENSKVFAKQAHPKKEFIVSMDERFRPVNLKNGPDGNMYIVDMHRGVIQAKAYMSPYLRNKIISKKLDTLIGMGRILKIVSNGNSNAPKPLNLNTLQDEDLIRLLGNSNGWLRDRAQQLLIKNKKNSTKLKLRNLLHKDTSLIAQIHILHTLNGLNALNFKVLNKFILAKNSSTEAIAHAFILLEQFASENNTASMIALSNNLVERRIPEIDLYILNSIGKWIPYSETTFFELILKLKNRYKKNEIYQESLVSGLRENETKFQSYVYSSNDRTKVNTKQIREAILNKKNNIKNPIYTKQLLGPDIRTAGYNLFRTLCSACHGINGEGIEGLAPPLKNSKYVTESSERLALVLLHGLAGPIHVNGIKYKFGATMPGFNSNTDLKDKDIQSIIEYLRNTFPGEAEMLKLKDIKKLRHKFPKNRQSYTEEELLQY